MEKEVKKTFTEQEVKQLIEKALNSYDKQKKIIEQQEQEQELKQEEALKDPLQQLEEHEQQILKLIKNQKKILEGKRAEVRALELVINSHRELNSTIKSIKEKERIGSTKKHGITGGNRNNLRELESVSAQLQEASRLFLGGSYVEIKIPIKRRPKLPHLEDSKTPKHKRSNTPNRLREFPEAKSSRRGAKTTAKHKKSHVKVSR